MRFALATVLVSLVSGCAASTPATPPNTPASPEPVAPASKLHGAGEACGGIVGFGCASGLYCSFSAEALCGAADQTGLCTTVPEACTEQYQPVCGCNDKTYGNACEAARDGVSVQRRGECVAPAASPALGPGATCGTRGAPGDCGAGFYCAFRSSCGDADSGGTCTERPQMCTKEFAPVCGCDGRTHGNACMAASAGASVRTKGSCSSPK